MPDPKRPIPYPDVNIDDVREYANRRADATSVRQLAKETGVGHTTLEKFLAGSAPYAKTRVPLCEWFLRVQNSRSAARCQSEDFPSDRSTHLEALLTDLRGEARTEARARITTALAQAYERMRIAAPEWLYSR